MKPFTKMNIQYDIWQKNIIKKWLCIFIPLTLLLSAVLWMFFNTNVRSVHKIIESGEPLVVDVQKQIIANKLKSIVSDVLILSESQILKKMLAGNEISELDLNNEYLIFSKNKALYDQVRYLNHTGLEIARVNFNKGNPLIVDKRNLQSKGKRYYFTESFELNKGEIFISPLDLNIENGMIEHPIKEEINPDDPTFNNIWIQGKDEQYVKPMIRFATPTFNNQGQKTGVVLVNYFATQLINTFLAIGDNAIRKSFLINRNGFWLKGPHPDVEWGFMSEYNSKQTFWDVFPELKEIISNKESGQYHTKKGVITFTTIYPLKEVLQTNTAPHATSLNISQEKQINDYAWKIISFVPNEVFASRVNNIFAGILSLYVFLVIFLAGGVWFWVYTSMRSKMFENEFNQTEKMDSIGTLAAGIAHEINNPLQFIATNIAFLSRSVDKILSYTDNYSNLLKTCNSGDKTDKAIAQWQEHGTKLSYIKKEVPKVCEQLKNGIARTSKIINAMKDFSEIQAQDITTLDINNTIENIVTVSHSEWHSIANIKLELDPSLPYINCYPSDIKQAIFNLILNAAQSIKDVLKNTDNAKGLITVRSYQNDDSVFISVADTGTGIPESIREKVFDYFFTTKKDNTRPGQGLSIAYQSIVKKHQGKLSFITEVGKGTTFTIELKKQKP